MFKTEIVLLKKSRQHSVIIKFEVLAMKGETDNMYLISYWRRTLGVILVKQEYKSTEDR